MTEVGAKTGPVFPEDFIWGAATAAYQIEGGAAEGGRKPSVWDAFCKVPGKVYGGHSGETACDHYHRWKEDVALIKSLNLDAYRFSFAWPRLIPDGTGAVNEEGIAFYDRLIDALLEAGVEPWGTLYHWDLPQALHLRGGWLNPDVSEWFADYAEEIASRFSDRVTHFMTVNEPQVFIGGSYAEGRFAPGNIHSLSDGLQAAHNMLLSHGRAVQALRAGARSKVQIGHAAQYNPSLPASESPEDISAARQATFTVCRPDGPVDPMKILWSFALYHDPMLLGTYPSDLLTCCPGAMPRMAEGDMDIISEPMDFLGINIYWGDYVKASARGPVSVPHAPGCPMNSFGWPVTPSALYWGARFCMERYGRHDVFVTENGIPLCDWVTRDGAVHDPMRIDYIRSYLEGVERGLSEGIPFKGYFYWSLMDNFEWAAGYSQRFGLTHVDYATGKRTPKDSAAWYARLAATNGASLRE